METLEQINHAYVYLIHFQNGVVGRCSHYLGYTAAEDVVDRLKRHRSGNGARLLAEANRRGITYDVVRTWKCSSWLTARRLELQIKKQHNHKRLCPICNPKLQKEAVNE